MKRIVLFLMSFFVVATITAQENKVKTYKIKSGYVKYKSLNKRESGTHEIWWDNYGDDIREERNMTTTTKFFGKKKESKTHTVDIMKGKLCWKADLETGKGTKGINPMYDKVHNEFGSMSEEEQEQTANSILGGLGGQRAGTESFMGYECEITKMWGSKVWQYEGVVLKSESKMLGMRAGEVAIDFQPNIAVSASKFEPLSTIKYREVPGLAETLARLQAESGGGYGDSGYPNMDTDNTPTTGDFVIKGTIVTHKFISKKNTIQVTMMDFEEDDDENDNSFVVGRNSVKEKDFAIALENPEDRLLTTRLSELREEKGKYITRLVSKRNTVKVGTLANLVLLKGGTTKVNTDVVVLCTNEAETVRYSVGSENVVEWIIPHMITYIYSDTDWVLYKDREKPEDLGVDEIASVYKLNIKKGWNLVKIDTEYTQNGRSCTTMETIDAIPAGYEWRLSSDLFPEMNSGYGIR